MDRTSSSEGVAVPMSAAERARRAMLAGYAQKAGRRSQQSGNGHRWTSVDAKHWGRLGGQCSQENKRRRVEASTVSGRGGLEPMEKPDLTLRAQDSLRSSPWCPRVGAAPQETK